MNPMSLLIHFPVNFPHFLEILKFLLSGTGVVGVFLILWKAFDLTSAVKEIKDNEIPHLQQSIDMLRKEFVEHLIQGK